MDFLTCLLSIICAVRAGLEPATYKGFSLVVLTS